MADSCATCTYWRSINASVRGHTVGDCRRRAPIALDASRRATFPATADDGWCGEFEQSAEARRPTPPAPPAPSAWPGRMY